MTDRWTRRDLCIGALALIGACASPRGARRAHRPAAFAELERRIGGRVGVAALDTATGAQLGHREDERFAMCSTFKWLLAAQTLAAADAGQLALETQIPFSPADLVSHAPVTAEHVAEGAMTVEALARAIVVVSDNTAGNLLLAKLGGPAAFTRYARTLGDEATRLDRTETILNENAPGDPRDTTTPRAMVGLMQRVLCGTALSAASRARLVGWLRACETGRSRLRAGLPASWEAGDKTGTGANGACNDVAIAFPPNRSPILIASYLSESSRSIDDLQTAHADIARIIVGELVPSAT